MSKRLATGDEVHCYIKEYNLFKKNIDNNIDFMTKNPTATIPNRNFKSKKGYRIENIEGKFYIID